MQRERDKGLLPRVGAQRTRPRQKPRSLDSIGRPFFDTTSEAGAARSFTSDTVNQSYDSYDTGGFRCCFSSDPTQ